MQVPIAGAIPNRSELDIIRSRYSNTSNAGCGNHGSKINVTHCDVFRVTKGETKDILSRPIPLPFVCVAHCLCDGLCGKQPGRKVTSGTRKRASRGSHLCSCRQTYLCISGDHRDSRCIIITLPDSPHCTLRFTYSLSPKSNCSKPPEEIVEGKKGIV